MNFSPNSDPARFLRDERRKKVDTAEGYGELFEMVKRVVEEQLGEHRAGLSLVLTNMPNEIGAYHPVGANIIVLNKSLITGLEQVTRNPKQVNSFIFMVLMHEYLHSLGYLDEDEVRNTSKQICIDALGEDHPTVRLATANWLQLFPQLQGMTPSNSRDVEVVRKFDSSSMGYIG